MSSTRWWVITGAPCSGKTGLADELAKRGHQVMPEMARIILDEELAKGRTIDEIRRDQRLFQQQSLLRKIAREQMLLRNDLVFFDRGIPDTRAYHRHLRLPDDPDLNNAISGCSYAGIFLLEPLPLIKDYARTETAEEQQSLHAALRDVYLELGMLVYEVPILSVAERADYVLKTIRP